MASLNKVFLIGNLTRDPELRYVPSGTAVTTFGMAINRTYTTQSGERKEDTCFVRVVVWAKQAETCNQYLVKGSLVFVEGRLQYRAWETEGQKRSILEVKANRVQFLGRKTRAPEEMVEPDFGEAELGRSGSEEPPSEEQPLPEREKKLEEEAPF